MICATGTTAACNLLGLPDKQFLLALCVRDENLLDPASWCQEMRALCRAQSLNISTSEHAERLMQWSSRLAMEAAGDRAQGVNDAFGLPLID